MQDIEDLRTLIKPNSSHYRLQSSCLHCPRQTTCQRLSPCIGRASPSLSDFVHGDEDSHELTRQQPELDIHHYEIIIIGAGVTGCATARELSKYTKKVLILEKEDDVSQGASKANSGIVHGGYDAKYGSLKAKLGVLGNRLFPQMEKELHFGFREIGSLVLAFSESEVEILKELQRNGEKNGVQGLKIIYHDEIIKMEPHVNPTVYAALLCPHSGVCSPYEYVVALAENAVHNGVELKLNHEVIDIQLADEKDKKKFRFIVKTKQHLFTADFVVNCAGIYADKVAAMMGANSFSIVPVKGEYILLNKTQGYMARHVLFPVPSPTRGKGLLVSPTYHGNLLLGPTARGPEDEIDRNIHKSQSEVTKFIIHTARHSVPDFDIKQALTSYAGLRAKANTHDFIIEESDKVPGFINAGGIDSPGLTSSPAVAIMIRELLQKSCARDHRAPFELNSSFDPIRPPIIHPKPPKWMGKADHPDPTHNIICRCEVVTEAEIVDALHRGIPVSGTDGVKKRTRAGMGFCQGRFCESRVAAIVARESHLDLNKVARASKGSTILPHKRLTRDDRILLAKL